ncbi:integrin beta-3 isoform X1 [Pogonomyrmex barbatus]|uniref:Integrin beta-3 isoform X1 n=1 Tax=Pogonomyrmex barbatus TaxID=144034 RepID=A0A6I9WPB8_9HYME|nr:integrin beta-3 isoform X1 [Pogonomyrmex barbatus]
MRTCVILCTIALAIDLANSLASDKIDIPIPCANTSDCSSMSELPRDAFCKDGYCMCPTEDIGVRRPCSGLDTFTHQNRIPGPLVYRTCKHDQECNFQGAICNYTINQCVCSKSYVPASNKQRCVEKVNSINASCEDINQCLTFLQNTVCENGKCVCAPDYHYINNKCWKIIGYGESCKKNEECSRDIDGIICTENQTCECAAETVLNTEGTKCLPVARKMKDECIETVQCTTTFEHSTCLDKICQCEPDFHYEHELMKCFPNKAINEACANNYECYQAEDYENDSSNKSVVCDLNRCTCASDYVLQDNKCVSGGSFLVASLSIIASAIALLVLS